MTNIEAVSREAQPQDTTGEYLRLFGGKPDMVYLLGGGLIKDPDGNYQLSGYLSPNAHGLGGGIHRMEAAANIAAVFPTLPIVSCGGNRGADGASPITYAAFVANELQKRGVAETSIFEKGDVYTTSMEMVHIIQTAGKLATLGYDEARIVVVTNEIYIPRVETSLWALARNYTKFLPKNKYEDFSKFGESFLADLTPYAHSNTQILFSACEAILSVDNPAFAEYYEGIKTTDAFKTRQGHELQGLKDLMVWANYNSRI